MCVLIRGLTPSKKLKGGSKFSWLAKGNVERGWDSFYSFGRDAKTFFKDYKVRSCPLAFATTTIPYFMSYLHSNIKETKNR